MSDTLKIYSNDDLSKHVNYPTAKVVEIFHCCHYPGL